MKTLDELKAEFYERYERPVIEPLVCGFSGIDPPLKATGEAINDHEELSGLLGGNTAGHYHLTRMEYEFVLGIIDSYPPEIYGGQVVTGTTNEEIVPYEMQGENVRK